MVIEWSNMILSILSFMFGSGISALISIRMLRSNIEKNEADAGNSMAESAHSLAGAADTIVSLYKEHFEKELSRLRDEVGILRTASTEQTIIIAEQQHQIAELSKKIGERDRQYEYLLLVAKTLTTQIRQLGAEPLLTVTE